MLDATTAVVGVIIARNDSTMYMVSAEDITRFLTAALRRLGLPPHSTP